MLGPLTNGFERQKALGITLQARIWWYKSRLNIDIDRAAYENYLAAQQSPSNPDPVLLDKIEEIQRMMGTVSAAAGSTGGDSSDSELPAWQLQTPKVDLSKKADDGAVREEGGEGGGNAPYPEHFQAIIEAVTLGKPVPGVREIPNTVVRQAV